MAHDGTQEASFKSYHFREKLLAVGPVDASDAQEVGVERLVEHIHVIPLEQAKLKTELVS
jgi:hypothetical protein